MCDNVTVMSWNFENESENSNDFCLNISKCICFAYIIAKTSCTYQTEWF